MTSTERHILEAMKQRKKNSFRRKVTELNNYLRGSGKRKIGWREQRLRGDQ